MINLSKFRNAVVFNKTRSHLTLEDGNKEMTICASTKQFDDHNFSKLRKTKNTHKKQFFSNVHETFFTPTFYAKASMCLRYSPLQHYSRTLT